MNCVFSTSFARVHLRSSIPLPPYASGKLAGRPSYSGHHWPGVCVCADPPSGLLHAQTFYGSINGVVKDPSGAVVDGVAVTVRESSTATEYKTVTNKSGSYRVSFLKPGTYTVRFEKEGFARYVTGEINIVLNRELAVDAALQLGTTSQVITVNSAETSLNDTNPQVGGDTQHPGTH